MKNSQRELMSFIKSFFHTLTRHINKLVNLSFLLVVALSSNAIGVEPAGNIATDEKHQEAIKYNYETLDLIVEKVEDWRGAVSELLSVKEKVERIPESIDSDMLQEIESTFKSLVTTLDANTEKKVMGWNCKLKEMKLKHQTISEEMLLKHRIRTAEMLLHDQSRTEEMLLYDQSRTEEMRLHDHRRREEMRLKDQAISEEMLLRDEISRNEMEANYKFVESFYQGCVESSNTRAVILDPQEEHIVTEQSSHDHTASSSLLSTLKCFLELISPALHCQIQSQSKNAYDQYEQYIPESRCFVLLNLIIGYTGNLSSILQALYTNQILDLANINADWLLYTTIKMHDYEFMMPDVRLAVEELMPFPKENDKLKNDVLIGNTIELNDYETENHLEKILKIDTFDLECITNIMNTQDSSSEEARLIHTTKYCDCFTRICKYSLQTNCHDLCNELNEFISVLHNTKFATNYDWLFMLLKEDKVEIDVKSVINHTSKFKENFSTETLNETLLQNCHLKLLAYIKNSVASISQKILFLTNLQECVNTFLPDHLKRCLSFLTENNTKLQKLQVEYQYNTKLLSKNLEQNLRHFNQGYEGRLSSLTPETNEGFVSLQSKEYTRAFELENYMIFYNKPENHMIMLAREYNTNQSEMANQCNKPENNMIMLAREYNTNQSEMANQCINGFFELLTNFTHDHHVFLIN
jgi:hypothetical protein